MTITPLLVTSWLASMFSAPFMALHILWYLLLFYPNSLPITFIGFIPSPDVTTFFIDSNWGPQNMMRTHQKPVEAIFRVKIGTPKAV